MRRRFTSAMTLPAPTGSTTILLPSASGRAGTSAGLDRNNEGPVGVLSVVISHRNGYGGHAALVVGRLHSERVAVRCRARGLPRDAAVGHNPSVGTFRRHSQSSGARIGKGPGSALPVGLGDVGSSSRLWSAAAR